MEESISEFEKLNSPFWETLAYRWLSYMLLNLGEIKQPDSLNRFLALAQRAGERTNLADALEEKAFWYFVHGQTEEASQTMDQATGFYKQVRSGLKSVSTLPARIAWLSGDLQQAKLLLLEQEKQLQVLGEKFNRAFMLQSLGQIDRELGNLDQAEAYLKDALVLFLEVGDPGSIVSCKTQMGILAYFQGEKAQSLQRLKDCNTLVRDLARTPKVIFLLELMAYPPFQMSEDSVQILGVTHYYYQQLNRPIGPVQRRYYDLAEGKARSILGDAAFESAFAEAANLSLDEALDLALTILEKL
jgi:tetratricopeptide (TPR) repeat protein